ncbi:1-phosphofructokinase family hexose kinase [Flexivirga caeni]|uniref:1-phosphofructokinase n=1 Tax=Flexivirga caeni TaxID=2294115 RepID=A0A3M9MFH6_9MICO|nr:hexose kinase [Flexivirga caeni]RNI24309.1 1-phosphofructokinase [Flexivirga caeni]
MILAVCLNPALDVTYAVTALRPGTSVRVRSVQRRAGGKGVNVASVLHQQGVAAIVTGPAGGSAGTDLTAGLDSAGIGHRFTPIAGATRQTVAVVDADDATVLLEPGPVLTNAEWTAFTTSFADLAHEADVVTMSGSLPGGVPGDAYGRLIGLAHAAGTRVILDCDGSALIEALHDAPDVVKINEHEAASTTGIETDSAEGVFAAAEELHALGAKEIVITRGAHGVAARTGQGRFASTPAGTVDGNPTGAGDAFTAGLAAAMAAGLDWPARLRRASAWAAAAVAIPTAGAIDPGVATDHETRTIVQELPA